MYILGLTGSIGMGKTWGAKCFRLKGVPVHDADASVHRLMASGGLATAQIDRTFPDVLGDQGDVDRQKLSQHVFSNTAALNALEAILHPLVRAEQRKFLEHCQRLGVSLAVLDIPLLFETGAFARVDAVVVMSAPAAIQRQRVLRRPGMTEDKLEAILARQTPDNIKRIWADFIVGTGATRGQSLRQIADIVKISKRRCGRVWSPHWGR